MSFSNFWQLVSFEADVVHHMLVMCNPSWLCSEHGVHLPSASQECPEISATSLQKLFMQ